MGSESVAENKPSEPNLTRGERYRSQLQQFERELQDIELRLEEIETERLDLLQRKEKLTITKEILEPICEEQEKEEQEKRDALWADVANLGVQECCYRVLLEEAKPLSAWSIKHQLEQRGIELKYKNPLAVIHTSLKRIPEKVRTFRRKEWVDDHRTRVAWIRYYEARKTSVAEKSAAANQ